MHEYTKHYHLGCGEALQTVHKSILKNKRIAANVKRLMDRQLNRTDKNDKG